MIELSIFSDLCNRNEIGNCQNLTFFLDDNISLLHCHLKLRVQSLYVEERKRGWGIYAHVMINYLKALKLKLVKVRK